MARQKQVFRDASEVAHVWAQQTQDYGRNPQGNIYFHGPTIYSYGSHYRIAALVSKRGQSVALVNSRGYSVTTSGHTNCVLAALRDTAAVFHVPVVAEQPTSEEHLANLASYFDAVAPLIAKQRKARVNDYRGTILARIRVAGTYAATLGCRRLLTKRQRELLAVVTRYDAGELDIDAAVAEIAGWTAAELDRQRTRQQRDAAARGRAEERREMENRKRHQLLAGLRDRAVTLWRSGLSTMDKVSESFSGYAVRVGECLPSYALLRVTADGSQIETSQGALVPIDAARRAWPYLKARQVPPAAIGHYAGNAITKNTFRIGCHTIPLAEIDALAAQLNLQ